MSIKIFLFAVLTSAIFIVSCDNTAQVSKKNVFVSKEECEKTTSLTCSFVMCDYVPEGKTFQEACPDGNKYWEPANTSEFSGQSNLNSNKAEK